MEGVYGDIGSGFSKALELKSSHGDVSTINVPAPVTQSFIGGHCSGRYHTVLNSPIFDPYASPDSPNSPLIRYLLSGSASGGGRTPLASVENLINTTPPARSPTVFKTPVKVEDDVLVMDGILVEAKTNTSRLRSFLTSSNSGGRSSSSTRGSEDNYTTNIFHKTDTCQSWEDSGSKCLAQICKAQSSSGSCTYGTKCLFVAHHHHQVKSTVSPTEIAMALPTTPETVSEIEFKHPPSSSNTQMGFTSTDWSPTDDGIEVTLTCSGSSSEDVDMYMHKVLYGPAVRKRLQVFAEICPE